MSIPNNYKIINENIKDFYNDIFLNDINTISTRLKDKVKTVDIFNEKSIKTDNKNKHKNVIVGNYIIPITYLIYSYIYIKFYNYQFKNQIIIENKLNYEMYKFVFSHKNPIIRKTNIFLYKYYKNQLDGNKKIDYTIEDVKIGTMKDNTIKFLEDMNNILKDDTKDLNILKNINDNFDKSIIKIKNIGDIISDIIKKIPGESYTTSTNIYTKIDDLSIKKKNIKDFLNYESEYNNFCSIYQELIKTNIKTININILKLNTKINIINEDNIILDDINIKKKLYLTEYGEEKQKYQLYKNIIESNIEVNQFLKKGKKLIDTLFSTNKSDKKINDIIKNIKTNKEDIIKKIYYIITQISVTSTISIEKIVNNIDTYKSPKNELLDQFIVIYKSIIYYEIIEFNYLFKKNNIEEKEIYNYKLENYIDTQRNTFNGLFEEYIDNISKNNKSKKNILNTIKDDYILKKENLTNDKDIIDDRSAQYNKKNKNIKNKLTKIEVDLNNLKGIVKSCDKIKKDILNLNIRGDNSSYKSKIMEMTNSLPYLKTEHSDNINKQIEDLMNSTPYSALSLPDKIKSLKKTVGEYYDDPIIKELNNSIAKLQISKTNLDTKNKESLTKNKEYDNMQKNIINIIISNIGTDINNNTKQSYFNTINTRIKNIDTEKNENEKDLIKNNCNIEFDMLDKILKNIDNKLSIIEFNKIDNKLYFFYKKDDIYKLYNNYFNDMTKSKKNADNLLTISNSNKYNNFMNTILKELNKYFIENKEDFFKKIQEIFNNNNNNNLISFLDQYKKYKDELIFKINDLLDKINDDKLKLNLNNKNIPKFIPLIKKKQDRIKKILDHVNDKIDTKGKYTVIIPSTDVLFLYIINLLIIIDFLTYFYE
jgi:hypothetical protein